MNTELSTIQYNDALVLAKKEYLLKINYFSYMFEYDINNKITFNHHVNVSYFELLLSFVSNNDILNVLNYDILENMLQLSIYLDYQYFIDKVKLLPYDEKKVNDVNKFYQVYLQTDRLDELYDILPNIKIPKLNHQSISLLQFYDLSLHNNENDKIFDLFGNRNLLNFETPLPFYKTYQSNCITAYEHQNILTQEEFNDSFKQNTNNVFEHFDWSNVCIAGGFLFGLINQAYNSLLKTSDIDLYVYHADEEVRKNTWEYVLSYFNTFNAKYYDDHGLIMIKLPNMKFSIQVIIMNYDNPEKILNSFDMNYCKLYYQGDIVYADIGCLVAFKHQLAICDIKFVNTIDTRIYKTIKKGLRLMKNKDIEKHTSLLQHGILNLDLYDLSLLDKYNYEGTFMDYKDIVWYNHCHTMKLYTLYQGYGGDNYHNINEIIEQDDVFLPNFFLDKIDITQLNIDKIGKMNYIIHCRYQYQNQLINLLLNVDDYETCNIINYNSHVQIGLKVKDDIKFLIKNYLTHFNFQRSKLLKNNYLYLHLYNDKLVKIYEEKIKKKEPMMFVTQLIHKTIKYNHDKVESPHLKFTLVDII